MHRIGFYVLQNNFKSDYVSSAFAVDIVISEADRYVVASGSLACVEPINVETPIIAETGHAAKVSLDVRFSEFRSDV